MFQYNTEKSKNLHFYKKMLSAQNRQQKFYSKVIVFAHSIKDGRASSYFSVSVAN